MNNRAMHWQDRLAASNWNPETFLIMGRLFLDLGQRLMPETLKRVGGTRKQTVFTATDWDQAYRAAPGTLTQITASFDPTLAREAPAQEEALGPWLRDTMNRIATIVTKMEKHTDRKTGFFTEEAMQSPELKAVLATVDQGVDPLLVELKAALDNLAALMSSGQPMSDWLTKAQGGDDQALGFVLSLNPWLIYHAGIMRRIQQSFTEKDQELRDRLAQLPRQPSGFPKHATIGLILIALWEAGLKKLTYKQIRGFLKEVGLQGLPTHQALERYAQRLGLKKNVLEGESPRGCSVVRSFLGLIVCSIFEFTELCRRRERRLQVRDREVRVISLLQTAESYLEAVVTEAGLWRPQPALFLPIWKRETKCTSLPRI